MNLIEITQGDPGACRTLLHNARFEGLGTEAFGSTAIADLFRLNPLSWHGPADLVVHNRFAAVFGQTNAGAAALFADIHAGNIARLWLLANHGVAHAAAARTAVPADFDRDQRRPVFAFEPDAHPALAPAHADRVARFGQALVDGSTAFPTAAARLLRVRPVVLRAFSDAKHTAVLLAVQSVRGVDPGGPVLCYAGVLLGADERLVSDGAGLAAAVPSG